MTSQRLEVLALLYEHFGSSVFLFKGIKGMNLHYTDESEDESAMAQIRGRTNRRLRKRVEIVAEPNLSKTPTDKLQIEKVKRWQELEKEQEIERRKRTRK